MLWYFFTNIESKMFFWNLINRRRYEINASDIIL